jgi:hypothetical protein
MMLVGDRLNRASVRSRARATRPEQMCCPSNPKVNLPPVINPKAMLEMVSQP